jgi:hypothetical protein
VDEEFGPEGDGGTALDLLGDPLREHRDPRGRKKPRINNELRDRVATLSGAGMDRQAIADAVGCSERTLRTYFLPELNEGKSTKRAEVICKLFDLGMDGNVAALKAFLALSQKAEAIPRAAKPARPGKKEQAIQEAQSGHQDSGWGELLH